MLKKIVLFLCCCLISFTSLSVIAPPKLYFYDEKCPLDRPFSWGGGRECLACDEPKSMRLDKEDKADFDRCPNRETVEKTHGIMRSRLKKCPKTHPVRDLYDSCVSCEELNKIHVKNKADCSVCPNRLTERGDEDTYLCRLKKCPEAFPLFNEGNCLSCDEPYWTHDDKKTCEKCPNRRYVKVPLAQKIKNVIKGETAEGCYLKPKYENKEPLFEVKVVDYIRMPMGGNPYYQNFYPCDEKRDLDTLPEICTECPNRDYKDGKCIFRECPDGSIKSEDNYYQYCSRCDAHEPINTTKEECHKCPDRLWGITDKGERCIFCKSGYYTTTSAEECARCSDFIYDPETKLCGTEESIQIKKRADIMFPPKVKLDELELAPLPGIKEYPEVVPLPRGKETAIK